MGCRKVIPLTDGMFYSAFLASIILGGAFALMYRLFLLTAEILKSICFLFYEKAKHIGCNYDFWFKYQNFSLRHLNNICRDIIAFVCIILLLPISVISNYIFLDGAGRIFFPLWIISFAIFFNLWLKKTNQRAKNAFSYLISIPLLCISALVIWIYRCFFIAFSALLYKCSAFCRKKCKK